MKKLFLNLFLFLLLISCRDSTPIEQKTPIEHKVSMIMVGDNLIHQTIYQAAKVNDYYDFTPFYAEIKPFVKTFDLAFINQETILGGKEIGLSSYPNFNSPFELGDALVDAGFNLISLANNHTLDRGEQAVINSSNYWSKQPVITSGSVKDVNQSQVQLFEKNSIKFAFVAYTYGTNGIPHPQGKTYLANIYSNEKAKKDLENIRNIVDIIIISMHWGEEYQDFPNLQQKQQATFLANLKVDLIIGHHPHVIQPIDIIETDNHQTVVLYSLGNFLSDQKGISRLIGMAATLDFIKTDDNEVTINNIKSKLLYRFKNNHNNFKIKWFDSLTNDILLNYDLYFNEKKQIIQTFYDKIIVN